MMLGERNRPNPTVQIPQWAPYPDDAMGGVMYPHHPVSGVSMSPAAAAAAAQHVGGDYSAVLLSEALSALQRYLPSNDPESEGGGSGHDSDEFACDEFRMYEFKVRRCARGRSHDWTECPFAHPGEKARRRDPRKFHYSGAACPEFRKGSCKRGDACEFAHGVFECWLHPARYRTQPCKDGTACRRRVCFFAHTPDQLRVLPQHSPRSAAAAASPTADSYDGSPLRHVSASAIAATSPASTPPSTSPNSPSALCGADELAVSLRQLQLSKVRAAAMNWGLSPRGVKLSLQPAFSSLPATPTAGMGWMDVWERGCLDEVGAAEPMQRVESGRGLRAKVLERLSKENSVDSASADGPDVGWVSELVK